MIYAYRKSGREVLFVSAPSIDDALEQLEEVMDIHLDEDDLTPIDGEFIVTFLDGEVVPEESTIDDVVVDELNMKWEREDEDDEDE